MNNNLPKFDDLTLPILKIFEDGEKHARSEIKKIIYSNYSSEQLSILIPSGIRGVIADRVSWAIYYLRTANVISTPSRGIYQITDNGKKLLNSNISKITVEVLSQFPEFIESRNKSKDSNYVEDSFDNNTDKTPSEMIQQIIDEQNSIMENEIIDHILNKDPYFFEELILKLLKKMGYGEFETTPKSHDSGIDGIIYQDRLGVDRIYTQAKRYKKDNIIQTPDIDKFAGVLHQSTTRSNKGIFITTSDFSNGARERAKTDSTVNIVLINGHELVQLMIEYNIGVQTKQEYILKEIDEEYFE